MSQSERRLAAIMFTDMVGYTVLGQENESLSLALVDEQRKLIRPILGRHNGREIKTIGDAFLAVFPNALDAVRCAYDIQRATREFNISLPAEKRVRLRVGLHLGDVVESQGDVVGDAVNVASRIESLATDGGVCLTRQVYDQVQNKFDLRLESLGSKSLKNVSAPLEVYRMVMPWDEEKAVSPGRSDRNRVAVLPLVNMSSDPNDEYFTDGMTEEMISTLSNISGLTVISRTSTMQYKGAKKNLVDIGKELGAGTLLEGSVRKAGNHVRITVQLLDALEDKHLWAQSYDRELQDVFAVQSDVATKVADSLRVRLLDREATKINKRPTESAEAYQLYLMGRQYWNKRSEEAVRRAMEYFQLAIDGDPSFALALVGIADCWLALANWGHIPSAEIASRVKHAVLEALKLDSRLAEAHTTYAQELAWYEWKWDEAELEFKRAIELNPNYATAHQWYSHSVLRCRRNLEEESSETQKALELDPLSPIMNLNMGMMSYFREEYDKAIECCEKALEIDPDFIFSYGWEASCYLASARYDKGIELFETYGHKLSPSEASWKLNLACMYGLAGRPEDAKRAFKEAERAGDKERPTHEFALAYLGLGETDNMFEYLERAAIQRDVGLPFTIIDPLLKRYRSDPRFLAVKSRVGI